MNGMTMAVALIAVAGPAAGAAVQSVAEPFALAQVRLLDGPFKDAQERDRKYLHDLDADRLLYNFRVTAGFPMTVEPYGHWEAPKGELRGHFTGHYLSACALMYASTGDEKLKAKLDYMVAELAKCQAALPAKGYNKGFLSAYPESFFDRVDACKPVWAPYYTLHKIMAGLLDVYQLCGNQQALEILNKMADWLSFRIGRLSHEQQQKALNCEHGGMNEVLANLYGVTGNPEHLKLARAFNHEEIFAPLAAGTDKLDGKHANTQIPKIIGAAREFELTGEPAFAAVAKNFWQYVALDRAYCIGGHSDSEHFFPVDQFAKHLTPATAETCNTYNMLKLTRHLFAWQPTARTMDFYERALLNQILASQDPDTGMMYYFASLKPGHFKNYNTPDNSFWCCTGTGVENHGKYADTIFFHSADTLYLNLFIASELTWKEKNIVVRQETKFPESDATRLVFKCAQPVKLELKIRHPFWAKEIVVTVNGAAAAAQTGADGYATIVREWKNDDVVEVRLPMTLRIEPLPGAPKLVALCYGPVVLAGELGREGLDKINLYAKSQLDLANVPAPAVPVLMCDAADLLQHVAPVAGQPLIFRTQGIGRPNDVTLSPYWRLHHQRFTVYWKLFSEADWAAQQAAWAAAEAERNKFEGRIVDQLQPGESQSETDHNYKADKSRTGYTHDRSWRDSRTWVSYDLKALPDQPLTLRCTYWGSDSGLRAFDILVDGEKIATQKLNRNKPNEFFAADYPVPDQLTRGKQKLTLKFQAHTNNIAGGVFGVLLLKPEPTATK
ncbi:MAG: glycoside hydrolase family 127 protein [Kiritimatiellaeota bacterium]|nr:glycoside hydrolase family 127 protein [Kiritimatiellota bacterium]